MKRLALLRVSTLPFGILSPLRAAAATAVVEEMLALEEAIALASARLEEALHAAAGEKVPESEPERARARLAVVGLKRDVHNGRALSEEKVATARPLLSRELAIALEDHGRSRRRLVELAASFRGSYRSDLAASRTELQRLAALPLVEEGIRLAGRSLLARVRSLTRRDPGSWGHDERHVAAKAAAYVARFCTKTSPNGVFCATALAEVGEGSLSIEGRPEIERVDVILNIFEASKITAGLAIDAAVLPAIRPRPNSTLRQTTGAWTFWKFASSRNPTEDEVLCRVKENPVLKLFIEEAGRGDRSADLLLDAVAARCGIAREELSRFLDSLVARGILVAEIEIPYNERRPFRYLAGVCRRAGCEPPWLAGIEEVEAAVDRLPSLDSRARIEAMDRIGDALERFPHTRPLSQDELFRLDAASSLRVRLPRHVLRDLRTSVALYARIFSAMYPGRNYEKVYQRDFLLKHPPDTDVDFLELYRGFVEPKEGERPAAFPDPERTALPGSDMTKAASVMARMRDLLTRPGPGGISPAEVRIDEEMVRSWIGDEPEPRWSAGVLFQIASEDAAALEAGRYRLVLSAVFNGAGLAQARFAWLHGGGANGDDNPIVADLRRAWSCLGREGAVIAETTYNHHARTANAGLRPRIFQHEIEMPGETAAPGATAIPLNDLVIRYDSARGRFILRSISLGVEVIPVISSGVNPVGITSFMVTTGYQGIQPVGYFPGFDAKGITHLPRVLCGKMVLFREKWVFRTGEWPATTRAGAALDDADYHLETARWRRRHGLPRHVYVHTSDEPKPRYLDLESPPFVDLLRRTTAPLAATPSSTLHVTEMLPGPGDLWIADERGRYASEFLVQLQEPS